MMRFYDYICRQHLSPFIFELAHCEAGDPSPSNLPVCIQCGRPASWFPSAQFKLNPEWGIGKNVPGYGWFDSKEKFDKHLDATGRLYYEPGMERDANRTLAYQDEKIDKLLQDTVRKTVQERL